MILNMNVAVILAGGVGQRMGAEIPKQFIKIENKPIIIYTLEKFEMHPEIDVIEIVCINNYIEKTRSLVEKYGIKKAKWIVPGGNTFQGSVCNGIFYLKNKCEDNDIVMIHMSVAPFIEEDIISDSLSVCKEYGNAISANPCLLCMAEKTTENYSDEGVLRETLMGLNTPQSFVFKEIYDAYRRAVDENFLNTIEPHTTSLMYKLGKRLFFSKGSQCNIKITTSEDLDLFKGYVLLNHQRNLE
jgi:2-C-methyl-D-erythritol 4-phosphate cytidylyltransferase